MIFPVGIEDANLRRVPWASLVILTLCIVGFFTGTVLSEHNPNLEIEDLISEWYSGLLDGHELTFPVECIPDEGVAMQLNELERGTGVLSELDLFEIFDDGTTTSGAQASLDHRCQELRAGQTESPWVKWGLVPDKGLGQPGLVTYLFIHADWLHLLGNLLFFALICGPFLEDVWGHAVFAAFFLTGGVLAGIAQVAMDPTTAIPIIGASGAISACTGAFCLRFARRKIGFAYFFIVFIRPIYGTLAVPAWVAGIFWFGTDLATQLWLGSDGVATMAHLGGMGFGILVAGAFQLSRFEERFGHPLDGGYKLGSPTMQARQDLAHQLKVPVQALSVPPLQDVHESQRELFEKARNALLRGETGMGTRRLGWLMDRAERPRDDGILRHIVARHGQELDPRHLSSPVLRELVVVAEDYDLRGPADFLRVALERQVRDRVRSERTDENTPHSQEPVIPKDKPDAPESLSQLWDRLDEPEDSRESKADPSQDPYEQAPVPPEEDDESEIFEALKELARSIPGPGSTTSARPAALEAPKPSPRRPLPPPPDPTPIPSRGALMMEATTGGLPPRVPEPEPDPRGTLEEEETGGLMGPLTDPPVEARTERPRLQGPARDTDAATIAAAIAAAWNQQAAPSEDLTPEELEDEEVTTHPGSLRPEPPAFGGPRPEDPLAALLAGEALPADPFVGPLTPPPLQGRDLPPPFDEPSDHIFMDEPPTSPPREPAPPEPWDTQDDHELHAAIEEIRAASDHGDALSEVDQALASLARQLPSSHLAPRKTPLVEKVSGGPAPVLPPRWVRSTRDRVQRTRRLQIPPSWRPNARVCSLVGLEEDAIIVARRGRELRLALENLRAIGVATVRFWTDGTREVVVTDLLYHDLTGSLAVVRVPFNQIEASAVAPIHTRLDFAHVSLIRALLRLGLDALPSRETVRSARFLEVDNERELELILYGVSSIELPEVY